MMERFLYWQSYWTAYTKNTIAKATREATPKIMNTAFCELFFPIFVI